MLLLVQELQAKIDRLERRATEPIAIVGCGCRFPGDANTPDAFWNLLCEGVDVVGEVSPDRWLALEIDDLARSTPEQVVVRRGGFLRTVDQFDPTFFGISASEAESIDPQQRLLLEVAWEALEHAAIPATSVLGTRAGVFIGISTVDYERVLFDTDPASISAYDVTGSFASVAAGRLSYSLGLTGPCIAIDTACSSSLVAVHLACQSLHLNESELALAGGVNLILRPELGVAMARGGGLAPDGRCRAFDAGASGVGRAEGCGVVVLKRLRDAEGAGDRILAVIHSTAINQDGRSNGLAAPNGSAQQRVIRDALARARIEPGQIGYVEAHGTGTPIGDAIEIQALAAVLGNDRIPQEPLYVGSVKTNLGHAEAAAGMAGLLKTTLALAHQEIPPTLHFKQPSPLIPWEDLSIRVATARLQWPADRRFAGVSAFGVSGTNAHVILEAAPVSQVIDEQGPDRPLQILLLSAKTEVALTELAASYGSAFMRDTNVALSDVCFTANTGRVLFPYRLAALARDIGEMRQKLEALTSGGPDLDVVRGHRDGSEHVRPTFLYSGEEPIAAGTGREIYQTQPIFRAAVDRCDEVYRAVAGRSFLDHFRASGQVDYDVGGWDAGSESLAALLALQYGLTELWRSWGVVPDGLLGYGAGRLAAACATGAIDLEEAFSIAKGGFGALQDVSLPGSHPAQFSDDLGKLLERGTRAFIELGPGTRLTECGRSDAPTEDCLWLPSLRSDRPEWETLLEALARLAVRGAKIDWNGFDRPYCRRRVTLPTYPFQRQRFWAARGMQPRQVEAENVPRFQPIEPILLERLRGSVDGEQHGIVVNYLKEQIAALVGLSSATEIGAKDVFADLGMDSLVAVELRNRIQTDFRVVFPLTLIADYPTIEALANYLVASVRTPANGSPPVENLNASSRAAASRRMWTRVTEFLARRHATSRIEFRRSARWLLRILLGRCGFVRADWV
jgi:acyl transferase domain-containing protein